MKLNKVLPIIGVSLTGLITNPVVAQNKPNFIVYLLIQKYPLPAFDE